MFASQLQAATAHEKELLEARARIKAQRQLAAAQAQAAHRALTVTREKVRKSPNLMPGRYAMSSSIFCQISYPTLRLSLFLCPITALAFDFSVEELPLTHFLPTLFLPLRP